MRLYLARHGEAENAYPDSSRQLTVRGKEETEVVYRRAAAQIESPIAAIRTSPLVRARQTADIALQTLPCRVNQYQIDNCLTPDGSVESLARILEKQDEWPLLLVGHQPLLGAFLAWLCDDRSLSNSVVTSSLHCLEIMTAARGAGTLLWSRQP